MLPGLRALAALLFMVPAAAGSAPCPSGYRAVLEGSGPTPGGTMRQVLHMRKIGSGSRDGQWMVYRFEQHMTQRGAYPQSAHQTLQDKAADGSPIRTDIRMAGNKTDIVMEGKIGLLVVAKGRLRHYKGGVAEGQIVGDQVSFRWLPTPNPILSGAITNVPEPTLRVSPEGDFRPSGPHSEQKFKPGATSYSLTNCDDRPVSFTVSSKAKWLKIAPADGVIPAGGSAAVSVALAGDLANLDEGNQRESIQFTNVTTGRGSTARQAVLTVKPHRWQASVNGHELDVKDPYWKTTTGRRADLKFNFTLAGSFEIGRKKGKWVYNGGRVTAADVTYTPIMAPPEWWNFKPAVCTNCTVMKGLIGDPIHGILHPLGASPPSAVQLNWGPFWPKARMWIQLKPVVTCRPMPQCRQTSLYQEGASLYYESKVFHDQISAPEVPLRNGSQPYAPFKDAEHLRFVYTLKRLE